MIIKALATGAIAALVGLGLAAPALADPTTFNNIACSCQAPAPQAGPSIQDQISQGIQQGLSDLKSGPGQP
ncbi:MAG TPA: hypothetical protein VKI00_10710 [Mycobacterium sp.]|jgi:hypothetical protein|uniref:hypothetical protein n=1 Tax=Mycobacterium sp. TaxID=1785 RepID=UPI002C8F7A1B|nr:hypothetical protein [Mycobacterium sp.]HME76094.1 hypothetical protein [Mycobacterium sp.]